MLFKKKKHKYLLIDVLNHEMFGILQNNPYSNIKVIVFNWFYISIGAVPVRLADRHSLLAAAAGPASSQPGQRAGETTFSSDNRGCGSPGPEERSYTLLDSGETQVLQHFLSLKLLIMLYIFKETMFLKEDIY